MDGVERVMVLGIFAVIVAILSIAAWGISGSDDVALESGVADGGASGRSATVITSDGSRPPRGPVNAQARTPDAATPRPGAALARGAQEEGALSEAERRVLRPGGQGRPLSTDPLAGADGKGRPVPLSSSSPVGPGATRRPEVLDPAGGAEVQGPAQDPRPAAPTYIEYAVAKGDTLWGIARRHFGEGDTKAQVQLIQQLNPGLDVSRINPGDKLRLPAEPPKSLTSPPAAQRARAGTLLYTIRAGDSLRGIARERLGAETRWREIYDLNRDTIADPATIHAGLTILVPEK